MWEDLPLNEQHWEKKTQDTMNGEVAVLLLPMDATTVIVIVPTQVVRADPGERYRYNSADAQMLTWLLENVYDDSYSSILSEKLWQPAIDTVAPAEWEAVYRAVGQALAGE